MSKSFSFKDTIAAISTAPGMSGISIIRISGFKSLSVLKKIFIFKNKNKNIKSHYFYYGHIRDQKKEIVDEVLVVFFKSPKTYTRENVAEIHCHGGYVTANRILKLIFKYGVRSASPGEFTERSFLNGRIDLTQAEAIADIIQAKTEEAQKIAEQNLQGQLGVEINKILYKIMNVYSKLLVNIDFPDEDIPEISKKDVSKELKLPIKEIQEIIESSRLASIYKEGLKVVLVGLPNAGKSSLLNALVKDSRAIVTEVPGTTRDTLEAQIEIKGLLVRVFDTAGITETEDRVEKEGVKRSLMAIKSADLMILVLEKSSDFEKFKKLIKEDARLEFEKKNILVVQSKNDLKNKNYKSEKIENKNQNIIKIIKASAKTGQGIKDIEKTIFKQVSYKNIEGSVFVSSVRQSELFKKALDSLKKADNLAKNNETEDKIIIELDEVKKNLGLIIGEEVTDNMLEKVFSQFCIGK